ncbi:MAG: hypothetical protein IJL47_03855 [Lachnospiraceae bacterium]|nr:hypothetical protein [Lachnospiraceae bacterium]
MQMRHEFTIWMENVRSGLRMTDKALLEIFGDMATLHGMSIGQGIDKRDIHHFVWMTLNWKLQITRRPKVGETVTAVTWARDYTRAQAFRDHLILDKDGNELVRATSNWVLVDDRDESILRLTPEIMDPYQSEPEHQNFPGFKFRRPPKEGPSVLREIEYPILRCMIDENGHVHNTNYLDMVREVLPEELDPEDFTGLEAAYRQEVKPENGSVIVTYGREGDSHIVRILDKEDHSLHAEVVLQ